MQKIPLPFRILLGGWFLAGWLTVSAAPSTNSQNYFMRIWQVEQGLPQNKVTSALQTRDGYLWIGTYSGLARFDGVRFAVFDDKNTPEMHSSRVTSLFESDDGTLWIGHENGDVTTYANGKFGAVEIRMPWESGKIWAITTDENHDIWLLGDSGTLKRLRDGLELLPPSGTAMKLLSLARSTEGTVWMARNGRLSKLRSGQIQPIPDNPGVTNLYVQGICASHDGGLWISSDGRIRQLKDDKWVQDLGPAPWGQAALTSMVETKSGTLLAGTSNNGFFILFPGTDREPMHFNRINGFQADWILSLLEDREGNLWIGTGGSGLASLRPNNIQTVTPPDRWRGRGVLCVSAGTNNDLWIGTEGAGLYHYESDNWENFGYTNGIGNSYVWSIANDKAGQLFVGTWGAGLFLRDGDRFKFAPGMENVMLPVPALLAAREGGLWAGTTSAGLLRYLNGKTNWFSEAGGNPLRDVRTIAEDDKGAVWFGTASKGLGCLENGVIRQFRKADGLSSDYIECLHFDENGVLWIGTFGGGLCRLKGNVFSVIDRIQGLPNSVIGDIEDDGNGFFWMSSHGGIIRASKVELNQCADGRANEVHWFTYGINDGMPTIDCSEGLQPAGAKTSDGRLWFPTSRGLVVINPNQVAVNRLPPVVALEELLVDDKLVASGPEPLRIAPGHSRFEFHYTGLSFVAPEKVSFKYRIEGLEKEWVNAGTKRVANYNFLPPGNYVFHAIACNNDGIWNEEGASLAFTLLPYFWQTWWFRVLSVLIMVAAASGIVWFDTRRRMRRRLEKLEREQAVERERARIAKDIHDDLGASLTRIAMLSQSTGETILPEPAAKNLSRIFQTARELTRAMDEIVWAVNPRHDTLDSLANYLTRFGYDYLSAAEIRCRLDVPLHLGALTVRAETRHNLFLAFKESLHNIVKHAAATEVRVELKLDAKTLTLTVADNGCGFSVHGQPLVKPGRIDSGNGLENMKRRLAEIGGAFTIQSDPGTGTTVQFSVPLKT